jgi:hypothetical protein
LFEGSTDVQTSALAVLNDVVGPAENLSGSFSLEIDPTDAFDLAGFASFFGVAPGDDFDDLSVVFDPTNLLPGQFEAEITLNPLSVFAGFDDLHLDPVSLLIRARIVNRSGSSVPEPSTWLLFAIGVVTLLTVRRRSNR